MPWLWIAFSGALLLGIIALGLGIGALCAAAVSGWGERIGSGVNGVAQQKPPAKEYPDDSD